MSDPLRGFDPKEASLCQVGVFGRVVGIAGGLLRWVVALLVGPGVTDSKSQLFRMQAGHAGFRDVPGCPLGPNSCSDRGGSCRIGNEGSVYSV